MKKKKGKEEEEKKKRKKKTTFVFGIASCQQLIEHMKASFL